MHALDALGSPVRRDILRTLRGRPFAVHEIAERYSVSRPAISRHLNVLEQAGLVQARTIGKNRLYSVRVQGFASVRDFVDEFWDSALERLSAVAREDQRQRR